MSITLTPRVEELIRQTVAGGRYGSDGEVIEEALLLLVERDQQVDRLRESVAEELAAIERGQSIEFTKEWAHARRRLSDERAQRGDDPHPDVCP